MDRREQIAHLAATREEEMLLVRVCEKLDTAVQRDIPAATNFLSKREQMLVCEVLRGAPIRFFGGLSTAEREISCYLPDYLDEDWLMGEDGPVAAVRATFFERDSLSHRDFLGALMGCGIKRETVGDIYVATGRCDFLVTRDILPYVLQNLTDARPDAAAPRADPALRARSAGAEDEADPRHGLLPAARRCRGRGLRAQPFARSGGHRCGQNGAELHALHQARPASLPRAM